MATEREPTLTDVARRCLALLFAAITLGSLACSSKGSSDAGSSAAIQPSAAVTPDPLASFEASRFCQKYGCKADERYDFTDRSGNKVHNYDTHFRPRAQIEAASLTITVLHGRPVFFGMTIFESPAISAVDFEFIYSFLAAIQPTVPVGESLRSYVRQNIEKHQSQICRATPAPFGSRKVWVGKVTQQTVWVGKTCALA